MRFRYVCKSWAYLIRSPSFITANVNFCCNNNNKNTTNLLFFHESLGFFSSSQIYQQEKPTHVTQLSNITHYQHYFPKVNAQSINGLVCASSNYEPAVVIFNPSTRECIELPHATTTSKSTYHFGFSPLTNKYKVLQVARSDNGNLKLNILTLGTTLSWRQLHVNLGDVSFETLKNCPFEKSVFLHGAIHWMHKAENIIVVFDIEDEKFRVIPLLDRGCCDSPVYLTNTGIVEVGGCLAVYDDDSEGDESYQDDESYQEYESYQESFQENELYQEDKLDNEPYQESYQEYESYQESFQKNELYQEDKLDNEPYQEEEPYQELIEEDKSYEEDESYQESFPEDESYEEDESYQESFPEDESYQSYKSYPDKRTLELWILKDYQNHVWIKETILLPKTNRLYINVLWHVNPLCTIHTGELAIVIQPPCTSPGYDDGPPALLLYNMKSKRFRRNHFVFPRKQNFIDDPRYRFYGRSDKSYYSLVTSFDDSIVPLY